MKQIENIVCLIAWCVCIVSCVHELSNDNSVKTYDCFDISIEHSIDADDVKAVLYNETEVKWVIGDAIGVYSDQQEPEQFVLAEDGKWHGKPITGSKFYAFYPYSEDAYDMTNPSRLKMDLSYKIPMVAKGDDNHLRFKQTVGILHFQVKSSHNMPFARLEKNFGGENLWGDGFIDMNDDYPILVLHQEEFNTKQSVSAYRTDYQVDEDGRYIHDYYFLLPEMVFDEGFSVRFFSVVEKDEEGNFIQYTRKTNKTCAIKRGVIKSFKKIDFDEEQQGLEDNLQLEREALIAFYNALDGDNWINNSNWCSDKPVGEWYGIDTTENGNVTSIMLSDNNLSGALPDIFGAFSLLSVLWLPDNSIDGCLPESIGSLKELFSLALTDNKISGQLPDSFRNLGMLRNLYISGNRLNGNLPEWIGELTKLRSLELDGNNLSGDLPQSLSNMVNLTHLLLANNRLTGSLPDLSQCKDLRVIDLSWNFFTGGVPSGFAANLNNYYILNLGNNCLSGSIAPEVWNHPSFPEKAGLILVDQRDGYKLDIDESKVPATRHVYESFDGSKIDLGAEYGKAEYTMIIRWAEWCPAAYSFTPFAIQLANQYKDKGLQTIWAYAGWGDESARVLYMHEVGLDLMSPHIIEFHDASTYNIGSENPVWQAPLIGTPFVEIVNKEGNIVFVDDEYGHDGVIECFYSHYSFSHRRSELEEFIYDLLGEEMYASSDYSADGVVHTVQTASEGEGINLIIMGDAFSDRMIADGTYETVMQKAVAALFSEEPYKSHKDYFNVYYIDVVSKNEVYYGESALSTWYGDGTSVGGNDSKVFEYAEKVLSEQQIDDAQIIVMMNRDYYAGTCYMYYLESGDYGRGPAIAYFPTSNDTITFDGLVSHEAGGHGFAKLADEYAYENLGAMPESEKQKRSVMVPYGWWKNADFTGDPLEVKWSQFIADSRYVNENIGCYEGAFTYWTGAWRPTYNSIMNHNTGGFNAPSRYAIWYRIHKLAYGDEWQGTYEDFVEYDKINRTPAAIARRKAQRRNFVEKDFEPLAPPVIVNKDWRELVK